MLIDNKNPWSVLNTTLHFSDKKFTNNSSINLSQLKLTLYVSFSDVISSAIFLVITLSSDDGAKGTIKYVGVNLVPNLR